MKAIFLAVSVFAAAPCLSAAQITLNQLLQLNVLTTPLLISTPALESVTVTTGAITGSPFSSVTLSSTPFASGSLTLSETLDLHTNAPGDSITAFDVLDNSDTVRITNTGGAPENITLTSTGTTASGSETLPTVANLSVFYAFQMFNTGTSQWNNLAGAVSITQGNGSFTCTTCIGPDTVSVPANSFVDVRLEQHTTASISLATPEPGTVGLVGGALTILMLLSVSRRSGQRS